MASLLFRLGRTAFRRWPVVFVVWVLVLAALGVLAVQLKKPMADEFSIPGLPSVQTQALQRELFPGTPDQSQAPTVQLVVAAPVGHTLAQQPYAGAVDTLITTLKHGPQVPADAKLVNPVAAAKTQYATAYRASLEQRLSPTIAQANAKALLPLSADQRVGTMAFTFAASSPQDVQASSKQAVLSALATARHDGLTAEAGGQGMSGFELGGVTSEAIGIAIAAVVLFLTFGSLVAAGLPLLTGLVGIGGGLAGLEIATHVFTIATVAPILATMIGLAVGIDYTLFILSRYRSELSALGNESGGGPVDRATAAGLAVGRAGSAVVFAGLTVIIALAALTIVRIPFLTAMGLAAAGTVLFAVLAAITLLPAVLGLLKTKIFGKVTGDTKLGGHARYEKSAAVRTTNGVRWARLVRKVPAVFVVAVVVVLGVVALPAKSLHLALPNDATASPSTTARKAADLTADAFGPGRNAPLLLVLDGRQTPGGVAGRGQAYGAVVQWAEGFPDVANAQIVAANADRTGAQVVVTPSTGAADTETTQLLDDMRAGQSQIEAQTHVNLGVTGLTAIQSDVSQKLSDALPLYLAVIGGLAFLLLMLVFRSLLVPLTATLGFLLTVLATLGATVLVFQKGLFGLVDGEPLISFMPVILVGVSFGLAMDYQVFLVTRMREAYVHGDDPRDAVVAGFRHGARVVTAAALIMISVFAAFIAQGQPFIKSMGFALAFGVLVDAFLVRMTLIPALMYLMKRWAWAMPRWLDRILPHVDVEGSKLSEQRARDRAGIGPDADSTAAAEA